MTKDPLPWLQMESGLNCVYNVVHELFSTCRFFSSYTNVVWFSFHPDYNGEERVNYVYTRARASDKSHPQVTMYIYIRV